MKIIDIVGCRPQFIKVAPVLHAIDCYNADHRSSPINEILVHTGQHYDYEMSQVFFDELASKPRTITSAWAQAVMATKQAKCLNASKKCS
jgi:UDP-N-acetylglucosamine 2-epimerase